jgi:HD domain
MAFTSLSVASEHAAAGLRRLFERLTRRRGDSQEGWARDAMGLHDTLLAKRPSADLDLIRRAYKVAARRHQGQLRKSGDPYISHPVMVATIMAGLEADDSTLCAAILHDTVEDTPFTSTALRREFGTEAFATLIRGQSAGPPLPRTIVALDIERSTARPDPVKAELRIMLYELFDAALRSAGIHSEDRDPFMDRGDGLLALIHPVAGAPGPVLLSRAVPYLSRLLISYNAGLSAEARTLRQLRIRVVVHAGGVNYDANGCYGEALDTAFRLLDAPDAKKALATTPGPLLLVVSEDVGRAVIRLGRDRPDLGPCQRQISVQVGRERRLGRVFLPT